MAREAASRQLTPERWQHVRTLLAGLIEAPSQDRAAFLDRNCTGDSELRTQLEDLLRAHEAVEACALDEWPAQEIRAAMNDREPVLGRRLGAYRIEAEIARGGMGTVYRAVRADDEYRKQVAIKLVDRAMLSRRSTELFRHERQILATLEHPNIARLLDGGTSEDGSPYLVMEYVEGKTITAYCDEHRLSIEDRLRLFQKICGAVHFAHQNLVIHRDIKPANILVTASGEPKLLDFGIAKMIHATDAQTQTQTLGAMTPAYASPEQLQGQLVTTATDIYSLGLVLYELLTGRYAYEQFTSPAKRQQAILVEDPESPSRAVLRHEAPSEGRASSHEIGALRLLPPERLAKRLSGDLESIVVKAISKEPEHRYSSAAQFSEDIGRHLRGEPVIAHQNTFFYRATKFVRRHRLSVATGFVAFLLFVSGVLAIVRAERRAHAQKVIAERRFNDVRRLANSLMLEVHDSIKNLPGATPARKIVVGRALEYLDSLARDAGDDVDLQRELATAYQKVGDVQGGSADANLGDTAGALDSYRKALQIREVLAKAHPANVQLQRELAGSYLTLGTLVPSYDEGLADLQKSIAIVRMLPPDSLDAATLSLLAGAYYELSEIEAGHGNVDSALANHFQALSIRESIKVTDPRQQYAIKMRLAGDYGAIAQLLRVRKEFDRALQYQEKAIALTSKFLESDPQNAILERYKGQGRLYLGLIYEDAGSREHAMGAYRQAAAILEDIQHSDPLNDPAGQDLAFLNSHMGELEVENGNAAGFGRLKAAIATWDERAKKNPDDHDIATSRAVAYSQMGRAYLASSRTEKSRQAKGRDLLEAREWLQDATTMWQDLESKHAVPMWDNDSPAKTAKMLFECKDELKRLKVGRNR